jgi:hypothetical protein
LRGVLVSTTYSFSGTFTFEAPNEYDALTFRLVYSVANLTDTSLTLSFDFNPEGSELFTLQFRPGEPVLTTPLGEVDEALVDRPGEHELLLTMNYVSRRMAIYVDRAKVQEGVIPDPGGEASNGYDINPTYDTRLLLSSYGGFGTSTQNATTALELEITDSEYDPPTDNGFWTNLIRAAETP